MFVEAEVINLGVFKDECTLLYDFLLFRKNINPNIESSQMIDDCLVNPNQFHRQTNVIFTNAKKTQIRSFRVSQLGFLIAVIAMFAIAPHECFANNMGKNLDVIKFRGGLSSPLSMSSAPVAELRTPPNMFSNAVDIGIAKANLGLIKIFILGILSGCHIAFGAFLMLSVGGACPGLAAANPGLQKIISGMFGLPFGLMMTVIGGGELFTGNTAVVGAALLEKKIKFQQLLKSWFFSYVGNFVGSVLLAYLVFGGALPVGPQSMASAVVKTSMTFQAAFIRGILCNWLVCMAVYMSTGASSLAGKMTAIFFPISAFIALGLEHSVANMFIIPVGMLFGAEVSVADMLLKNLLPVTLGNIVGGAGCVALGYAASYGNSTSKLFSLPRGGFSNQKPNFLTKMIGFTKDFTKRMIKTSSSRLDDTKRTGSSYLPAEALERAKVGNNVEKIKQKVDPVTMWDDVHDYAAAIRAGTTSWEEIGTDKIDFLVKYAGMFHRKKATPGKFMMRLRIPNGLVTSSQMHYFGDAVKPYGPSIGVVDITTRMNIQLRSPPLEDAADIVKELQKRGLTSLMSGLDNLRNMVGSPIAGIDPHEIYDTRELNKQIDNWYTNNGLGNPEWANMPRKFNIAVSGTRDDFSHTIINDIGLQACPHAVTGEMGFNVVLGGYISIKRIAEAIPMNAWIPASDALNLCKAILTLFRDEGSRGDRQKTRLMWLIETKTLPVFIDMVAAQMASYKGLATYTFESVQVIIFIFDISYISVRFL